MRARIKTVEVLIETRQDFINSLNIEADCGEYTLQLEEQLEYGTLFLDCSVKFDQDGDYSRGESCWDFIPDNDNAPPYVVFITDKGEEIKPLALLESIEDEMIRLGQEDIEFAKDEEEQHNNFLKTIV